MDIRKISLIEPHPDDGVGSASALCLHPSDKLPMRKAEFSAVLHTMARVNDTRDDIELTNKLEQLTEHISYLSRICENKKYYLPDLHWNERVDMSVPYIEALPIYIDKYGPDNCFALKEALRGIVEEAKKEGSYLAIPLGLLHPMHVLVSFFAIESIKEVDFPISMLWIYVDHPYDWFSVHTSLLRQTVKGMEQTLGCRLERYDCIDINQDKISPCLRDIYGDEYAAQFDGTLEKTLCACYLPKKSDCFSFGCLHKNDVLVLSSAMPYKNGGLQAAISGLVQSALNYANDIRVIMPKYQLRSEEVNDELIRAEKFEYLYKDSRLNCVLESRVFNDIIYYIVDIPELFTDKNKYAVEECYVIFCDIVISSVLPLLADDGFLPEILHCNDWQMASVPFLLKTRYKHNSELQMVKTIYTIHAYGYKGIVEKRKISGIFTNESGTCVLCASCDDRCCLDDIQYLTDKAAGAIGVNQPFDLSLISLMSAGMKYADVVTTVSEGYAKELSSFELFKNSRIPVVGIRNGILQNEIDPAQRCKADSELVGYNSEDFREGKKKNKIAVQRALKLGQDENIPMFCVVSRLSKVKGIDDIILIMDRLMALPVQLVIVGDDDYGAGNYSAMLSAFHEKYPDRFCHLPFSEEAEFRAYAASDVLLMPSLSESCGTTQLFAMRYGVVPVVSKISAFDDTVSRLCDEKMHKGVGYFTYRDDCWMLLETINAVLEDYKNKELWEKIVHKCMVTDFSWENYTMKKYALLYHGQIEALKESVFPKKEKRMRKLFKHN